MTTRQSTTKASNATWHLVYCSVYVVHYFLESQCEILNQTLCQSLCEGQNKNAVKGATNNKNCMICECEIRKEEERDDDNNSNNNNDNSGEYFCTHSHVWFGL